MPDRPHSKEWSVTGTPAFELWKLGCWGGRGCTQQAEGGVQMERAEVATVEDAFSY